MFGRTNAKRSTSTESVNYTFDRNGAFVVDPYSLLSNRTVRAQISAAAKLGRVQTPHGEVVRSVEEKTK